MSVRVFLSLDNTVKSILPVFEFLYSYSSKVYILKSAVVFFCLADQVQSTVWDRWTAQGNSFLQVLCHYLPGVDFNGADNLELEIPLILTKY